MGQIVYQKPVKNGCYQKPVMCSIVKIIFGILCPDPIYSICVSVKDLFLQRTIIRDIAIIAEGIDKLLDKASLTILLEQDLLDSFK